MQPSVELGDGYEAGKDAEVKIALEVLPDVPAPAIDGITLERLTVPVDDAAVDAQLEKFASQQKRWDEAAKTHTAKQGEIVVMDVVGKADGPHFDGSHGAEHSVAYDAGRLDEGFEQPDRG